MAVLVIKCSRRQQLLQFQNIITQTLNLIYHFYKRHNVSTETFTTREYEHDVFDYKFEIADVNEVDFLFPKNKKIIKRIARKAKRFLLNPKKIK